MREPIIIDSNLLLLLMVGITDPDLIRTHRRLRNEYTAKDFLTLFTILGESSPVITPHTLTETSNLLRLVGEPVKSRVTLTLRAFIDAYPEIYVESKIGASKKEFIALGLTDSILLEVALLKLEGLQPLLLTVDLDLFLAAEAQGCRAVNFNHLRDVD